MFTGILRVLIPNTGTVLWIISFLVGVWRVYLSHLSPNPASCKGIFLLLDGYFRTFSVPFLPPRWPAPMPGARCAREAALRGD